MFGKLTVILVGAGSLISIISARDPSTRPDRDIEIFSDRPLDKIVPTCGKIVVVKFKSI